MKNSVGFRVKSKAYDYIATQIEQVESSMGYYVDENGKVNEMWETEYRAYQLVLDHLKTFK